MHDRLFAGSDALGHADLRRLRRTRSGSIPTASNGELDAAPSTRCGSTRDVESAEMSGAAGTPTFFINGRRHHGSYDADALRAEIDREARTAATDPGRARRRRSGKEAADGHCLADPFDGDGVRSPAQGELVGLGERPDPGERVMHRVVQALRGNAVEPGDALPVLRPLEVRRGDTARVRRGCRGRRRPRARAGSHRPRR